MNVLFDVYDEKFGSQWGGRNEVGEEGKEGEILFEGLPENRF